MSPDDDRRDERLDLAEILSFRGGARNFAVSLTTSFIDAKTGAHKHPAQAVDLPFIWFEQDHIKDFIPTPAEILTQVMPAVIGPAQGHGLTDRAKTPPRVSTKTMARPGE